MARRDVLGEHTPMWMQPEERHDELGHGRPMLLALLRDHTPDGRGYGGANAARLETAADRYLIVYPDDREVREAWAGFYERVSTGSAADGRQR